VQPFILANGITYPVGIAADQAGWGSGGIPHAYLVGPDGVVVWEGHPAELQEGVIEDATRKAKDFYVRKVVAEVKPAAAAFEKGKLSEAKALAEAAKAKGGRGVEEDADYILRRVAETLAFWNRTVETSSAEGQYGDVFDALGKIQKHCPGGEEATAAAAKEKELKADPAVLAELDAWKKLDRLIEESQRAEGDEKKLKAVAKKLEKFLEANGSSKAAKRARQVLSAVRK